MVCMKLEKEKAMIFLFLFEPAVTPSDGYQATEVMATATSQPKPVFSLPATTPHQMGGGL